ncbi:uncharacterized protein METZ01_LOCUS425832 [marine metagenome]|uniref:Uncharacterized protein n=1 Tax=marine metagenome TaxID=408172 RepID=A0A382XRR5_9ZZZZ
MVAIAKQRLIIFIFPPVSKKCLFLWRRPDSQLAALALVYCRGNQRFVPALIRIYHQSRTKSMKNRIIRASGMMDLVISSMPDHYY